MTAVPASQFIQDASALQRRAADPNAHVWVMASAGTGKTTVLVQRYIRLVLAGTQPSRILCLTYTKAAATQMKERILRRLSSWVCMDEVKLRGQLTEMMQRAPTYSEIMQARGLFNVLLDQLDSLNIMTIHAFCQSLLARFQVEAGLPGGAEIMDDPSAKLLLSDVLSDILATDQNAYIERLAQYTADGSWEDLISKIVQHRSAFRGLFESNINTEKSINAILKVDDAVNIDDIRRKALHDGRIPFALLDALPPIKDVDVGAIIESLRSTAFEHRGDLFPAYASLFLTKSGTIRKTVKFKDDHLSAQYFEEAQRVLDVYAQERALMTAACSRDLCTLARAALERYQERKDQRGVLDYDDLIERTLALLSQADAADWVRFKLDGGIDQVLLDEAQDTSPAQWQIIAQIVQEYFAGIGRRDPEDRTLFVVGDHKQSIYSFQGADPARFGAETRGYIARIAEAGREGVGVRLAKSYRSTAQVLAYVDSLFSVEENRVGLMPEGGDLEPHEPTRREPGCVDLWPLTRESPGEEREAWEAPVDAESEQSANRRLAEKIAADRKSTRLNSSH